MKPSSAAVEPPRGDEDADFNSLDFDVQTMLRFFQQTDTQGRTLDQGVLKVLHELHPDQACQKIQALVEYTKHCALKGNELRNPSAWIMNQLKRTGGKDEARSTAKGGDGKGGDGDGIEMGILQHASQVGDAAARGGLFFCHLGDRVGRAVVVHVTNVGDLDIGDFEKIVYVRHASSESHHADAECVVRLVGGPD